MIGAFDLHFPANAKRTQRKRFLAIAVAALAILGASLGVSFAGDSGTASLSVSGGNNNFVYAVSNGAALPNAVTSLKYTPLANIVSHAITTAISPGWTPVAGSAGSVTTAGDIGLIDATTVANAIILNVYVTNLAALQQDYSSYSLPINVYSSTCPANVCTWAQDSAVIASAPTYLTNSSGVVTLKLPTGKYYDVTVDTGGALYCISTTASGGTLSPSFYFVATAT
ncbi:MAG TPA: hypothetical protein VFM96_13615 [Gaiellaceae bacterium]|nr:hypothetical protein [Gaiellaceae bacterium]